MRLGADLDATESDGRTALMWTACVGELGCARALLDAGADRTIRAHGVTLRASGPLEGKTALDLAEGTCPGLLGHPEVAALLREPENASQRQAREAHRKAHPRPKGCCVIC